MSDRTKDSVYSERRKRLKLYLIRHGETDWNKIHRLQGRSNVSLNDHGRELARLTKEALKDIPFDAAYTSPLDRAAETGEIILEGRNLVLHKDWRLAEADFGIYEGIREQELRQKNDPFMKFFDDPEKKKKTGGAENHKDVMIRAKDFLESTVLPGESEFEHMVIFSHGAWIHAFLTVVYHRGIKDFWHAPKQANCGVSIIEVQNGSCRVLEESRIFYSV